LHHDDVTVKLWLDIIPRDVGLVLEVKERRHDVVVSKGTVL